MLQITVYGPGCAKCKETEKRVREVVKLSGVEATITHATDFAEMARAGVFNTPAVAVNGVIKVSGKVPEADEIRQWIGG